MASRNGQIRLGLWENLNDHMVFTDNKPLLMLGDFNVILYSEDHSKGFANIYQAIREFRSYVQQLGMEYLARNGLFFTWVQKRKDLESGIMKKLDRVIRNSDLFDMFGACYVNFLPYITSDHCHALLVIPCSVTKRKRNGNVYEKVKKHRDELKKVQTELDKDPQNVELKEVQMVINSAYKVAVIDEEKVLKQKTKIESLKEDVKGLFSRKIDADSALYMVRHVTNEEIKLALFDIDDNKAPDLDGTDVWLFSFGFHKTMVECIMVCLNSASFSICLNRESHGFFKDKRGLRQGDTVSPYLFTIIMEVFTLMLRRQLRVRDWRNKSLSFVGRIQLIASVLSYLNVFWASMFILPQGVCEEINKIFKEFLWKSNRKRKIRYSVACKEVCMQTSEGGLGLKSIHVWNEALMAKHL
ncbi:RNA-directed DNA polymerase, eukaryota, reverse transcriptase zinc-binding domain protein [Tanacetum coccineum]